MVGLKWILCELDNSLNNVDRFINIRISPELPNNLPNNNLLNLKKEDIHQPLSPSQYHHPQQLYTKIHPPKNTHLQKKNHPYNISKEPVKLKNISTIKHPYVGALILIGFITMILDHNKHTHQHIITTSTQFTVI
jgi:hypothetical protein